jgi:DNA-binding transcriptional ArsR family regulator
MSEVLDTKNASTASEPQGQVGHSAPDIEKMRADMPSEEVLSDLADLYKMFGDSTRLSILSALRYHEYCVTHLAELLNMTTSAISHQLRILRASNLVRYRREGKQSFYSLADEHVEQIIDMGLEHIIEE